MKRVTVPPVRAQETEADMERAVFCMCAPGQTQDTVRVYRAILKGCIPVTMFRANDLPFARFLGMPYSTFMVNVQPDDYAQLNAVLRRILQVGTAGIAHVITDCSDVLGALM